MDRVSRRIIGYVAVVGGLAAAIFILLPWPPSWPHLVAAMFFLVPGRIQGALWRSFFKGRQAMSKSDYAAAEMHFLAFLDGLKHHPPLRHAAYLAWNFYTWDAEAMTRNNLGACRLVQGNLESAETELMRALDLDPGFPLPYFNLAVLAHTRGEETEAERLRAHAAKLGYRAGKRERLISTAGSMLTAIEGREGRIHDAS